MSYLGIDIGTSGCKAAVVKKSGEIVSKADASYELLFSQKGYAELDPGDIWAGIIKALKALSPFAGEVTHLSLSGFGEAFVMLDKEDKPLCRLITYADSRCVGMDAKVVREFGAEEFFSVTGAVPNATHSLFKLLWLKEHEREAWNETRKVFLSVDYFTYLLCGKRGVDPAIASKTVLYDIHRQDWSDKLLERFGIPRDWFSPILPIGTVLGELKNELSEELGLPGGIKVCLGTHDQVAATLGGGAVKAGCAILGEGSTESLNLAADDSCFEHSKEIISAKLCIEPYLGKGSWLGQAAFLSYGNSIRWFLGCLGDRAEAERGKDESVYAFLEQSRKERTELMFFPNLSGTSVVEPDILVPGSIVGLTLDTTYPELYRALMQGLNFETRIMVEAMEKMGFAIRELTAAGGVAKNKLFMQNKSDILRKSLRIPSVFDAGILGLAMICAVSDSAFSSYEEAAEHFVSISHIYSPVEDYEELYTRYLRVRDRLQEQIW